MGPRSALTHKRLGGSEVRRWASVDKVPGSNPGQADSQPKRVKPKQAISPKRVKTESWEWAHRIALDELYMTRPISILRFYETYTPPRQ